MPPTTSFFSSLLEHSMPETDNQFQCLRVQPHVHHTSNLSSTASSILRKFWDGPRHFEPWSDDEDSTSAGYFSPSSYSTPTGASLNFDRFNVHQAWTPDGTSVESGLEPATLWSRSLGTKPPQPIAKERRQVIEQKYVN
ncbi:hypothetical protein AVEN_33509-1 [Araneus ventricosus]|uniref:Uncharacterized protein n=1 Tax=Araneus ventricosus TaxID=182803 RepID=A0A4Y2L635_ARAVE|nr:hypothetical protein AVEN_33509-1 [Araneus ventricosus]